MDLIIKITICCAFANLNNKKILTAEKVLESTRCFINFIEKGKIVLNKEGREEAPLIPIAVLKQKYLLHKGLLLRNLNRDRDAARCFTHLMVNNIIILFYSELAMCTMWESVKKRWSSFRRYLRRKTWSPAISTRWAIHSSIRTKTSSSWSMCRNRALRITCTRSGML